MTYLSKDWYVKVMGSNLAGYSPVERRFIDNALWDYEIEAYVTVVTCEGCGKSFMELLEIALKGSDPGRYPRCISCDEAAKISSAVINVMVTG